MWRRPNLASRPSGPRSAAELSTSVIRFLTVKPAMRSPRVSGVHGSYRSGRQSGGRVAGMGERTSYTPGTFSWADLTTTDQDGAKAFYTALFGWEAIDN